MSTQTENTSAGRKESVRRYLLPLLALLVLVSGIGIAAAQNAGFYQAGGSPATEVRSASLDTAPSAAPGTSFTYQGQLKHNGSPVSGDYDFQFILYDAAVGGSQVGPIITATVPVTRGLFTVDLDFGAVFSGLALYLNIGVTPSGGGTYTPLVPRQALTAVPYAHGLVFPFNASPSTGNDAFTINNTGGGGVGDFRSSSNFATLFVQNSGDGNAFRADTGSASTGNAVVGLNYGTEGYAGQFEIVNDANYRAGVYARTTGDGSAADLEVNNTESSANALFARTGGTGWAGYFVGSGTSSSGVYITVQTGQAGLNVAAGTKNAVVATSDGARMLYSEESSQVWFSDYGFGQLHDGQAQVSIDPLFAQTVNLSEPYHVFVQAYGDTQLYVVERTPESFVVRAGEGGDPSVEFSYRLVALRRGYEDTRLERAPWADDDPNLYPEKRALWEARYPVLPLEPAGGTP
jgi:hypothetical protein